VVIIHGWDEGEYSDTAPEIYGEIMANGGVVLEWTVFDIEQ
jgi:hypothetical protein